MLRCVYLLLIAVELTTTLPPAVRAGQAEDKRLSETESDLQLIERAFNSLRNNPAEAARIAGERLAQPAALSTKQRAFLLWIGGSGFSLSEKHADAMRLLTEAEDLTRKANDQKSLRRVLRYIAASAFELGQYQRGSDAAAEALQISAELKDTSDYVALLHNERANNENRLGNFDLAIQHYQQALESAEAKGNQKLKAMVIANLASLYDTLEQYESSLEMHQKALAMARVDGLTPVIAATTLNLGQASLKLDRIDEAIRWFSESRQVASAPGLQQISAGAERGLGEAFLRQEDFTRAREHFTAAQDISRALNDAAGQLAAAQSLEIVESRATTAAGNAAELRASLAEAERTGDAEQILNLHQQLASLCIRNQDWEQAVGHLLLIQEQNRNAWTASLSEELARVRAELDKADDRQRITRLEQANARKEAQLRSHQLTMVLLTIGVTCSCVGLLILWRVLAARRRAIEQLRTAHAEIRQQKQVQLAIEKRLASQQKAESLSLMAAGIAHDFNNLLTAIAGLAEVGSVTPAVRRKDELFSQISDAAFQAADLTSQLLQYLGRPTGLTSATDLVTLIESSQGLLTSVARPRATIEVSTGNQPLPAYVDTVQARQIIVNLVSNAADAMSRGGIISISAGRQELTIDDLRTLQTSDHTQPGTFCYLRVRDQGSGIPENVRSRIFDPYFSTKSVGRGLGLASVLGIVRSCSGAADVESVMDLGTTITIYFPAAKSASTIPGTEDHPSPEPWHAAEGCAPHALVLVVDDEPLVLNSVSESLESSGFRVLRASNAGDAVRLVRNNVRELKCIVTDYAMPGESGVWLAMQVRQISDTIPVIVCSGYSQEAMTDAPRGTCFLQKPFLPRDLIAAVVTAVQTLENTEVGDTAQAVSG